MVKKRALITGITGQDGFYLANLLLEKGYDVCGMYRKSVLNVYDRVPDLDRRIKLVEGDLRDISPLILIIQKFQPEEIYNLAAQSFLPTSWEEPEMACDINSLGVLRLLDAVRMVNPKIRVYQASSREIFGMKDNFYPNEESIVAPKNLYASAKAFAQFIIESYIQKYGMYISTGIAFNHESPRRGKEFVTRKITNSVARIKLNMQDFIELGNLDSRRDWGFAGDFVEAMWLSLQKERPGNYLLATGETHSVREFVEEAFRTLKMDLSWEGRGLEEVGKLGDKIVIKINKDFYRPENGEEVRGDISKAKRDLEWVPKTNFKTLIEMMVKSDLKELKKTILVEDILRLTKE